MTTAPVGKSGPFTKRMSSSGVDSGLSRKCATASITSPRLCGGMSWPSRPRCRRRVHEQVREAAGQDERLLLVPVEIGDEATVSARCRAGARAPSVRAAPPCIDRPREDRRRSTEVAVAVDQRRTERPVLRHAYQCVVNALIAVRVVLLQHLANRRYRLTVRPVRAQARFEHRPQDPAVDRLQAVADVRERPSDDDRHRVVEVGALDLLLEPDGLDPPRTARSPPSAASPPRHRGSGRPSRSAR